MPVVASLQVQLVRLLIVGTAFDGGPGLARERWRDRLDDRFDDLVLDGEHVSHLAVVALGPDVIAVGDVDELSGDAQPVPGLADAAFEYGRDAQFLADVSNVDLASAEPERRRP